MDQRVSRITLGVSDMECAVTFYEALGWTRAETQDGDVAIDPFSSLGADGACPWNGVHA